MAPSNKLKNMLVLVFDWILYRAGVADNCQVTVTQPKFQEADSSTNTVFLKCAFSASGCSSDPPEILWFRFLTDAHEDLCASSCRDPKKYKVHVTQSNTSLEINDLTADDNALYICGIAFSNSDSPHSKKTGDGTVLTKAGKEPSSKKLGFVFMIIISSLLFLYSSTAFTFLVLHKKVSNGRKIFQAIAQEIQKQRYAEHWQQP
ncbi:IGSF6 protein, partial [Pitta sordida]|nr:IGSF6 protein [Pitta sordida]